MEPPKKIRRMITPDGRTVIVNVYNYLKEEYIFTMMHKDCNCDLSHLRNIAQRTADATNVSLRAVAQMLADDKRTNTMKKNKVYKFKKSKSVSITEDEGKIRQELELAETAILAKASEEKNALQLATEVKIEKVEIEENLKWEEDKVKTETEEEIYWKEVKVKTEEEEEEDTYLEEVDIKEEAIDYEITIEDERIG